MLLGVGHVAGPRGYQVLKTSKELPAVPEYVSPLFRLSLNQHYLARLKHWVGWIGVSVTWHVLQQGLARNEALRKETSRQKPLLNPVEWHMGKASLWFHRLEVKSPTRITGVCCK